MKTVFPLLLLLVLASCANNLKNTPAADTMNEINTDPLLDTTIDTLPNGYAPPNDSINHDTDSALH